MNPFKGETRWTNWVDRAVASTFFVKELLQGAANGI
jgi:hypothetical protein